MAVHSLLPQMQLLKGWLFGLLPAVVASQNMHEFAVLAVVSNQAGSALGMLSAALHQGPMRRAPR